MAASSSASPHPARYARHPLPMGEGGDPRVSVGMVRGRPASAPSWGFAASLGNADEAALHREQVQVEAAIDPAPDAVARIEHEQHGDQAQDDQVPGAVVGQELAQDEVDDHADDRPLDRADAADYHHEDHDDGPVLQAEARLGRDAQLLQEDQPAGEAGAERDDDEGHELGAESVDADAARGGLAVADRGQRQADARAQARRRRVPGPRRRWRAISNRRSCRGPPCRAPPCARWRASGYSPSRRRAS